MNAAPADPRVLAWMLWLWLLHWSLALTAIASRLSRQGSARPSQRFGGQP